MEPNLEQSSPLEPSGRSTRDALGRAALIILGATILVRLLGLFRDQLVAYYFGAQSATDAFFLAQKLPHLLAWTLSAALTATFIPVFTDRYVRGRKDEAWSLSVHVTNATAVILLLFTALGVVFAPWVIALLAPGFDPSTQDLATTLFRVFMLGIAFEGLAGIGIAVLNSRRRFAVSTLSPAAGSIVGLTFLVLFAEQWGIFALAWGMVAGAAVTFALLFGGARRLGMLWRPRLNWRHPGMSQVGMMIWPVLLGSAVGKISIFADQILGSLLGDGAISALAYSEKLFQIPLGLFVAGITVPIFPLLSEYVAGGQTEKVKETVNLALRLIAFVMFPAMVGMMVLRTPLVGFLFEHGQFAREDTLATGWALLAYSLGLFSFAGRDTLTRAFYAYHDTRTPIKISTAAVVVNVVCSFLLMQVLGVAGLALGTSIALTVNFVVLMQLLRRRLGPMQFGSLARSVVRIALVALVMGGVVWFGDSRLAPLTGDDTAGFGLRLGASVLLGGAVYLGLSTALRLQEMGEVWSMLSRQLRRPGRRPAGEPGL